MGKTDELKGQIGAGLKESASPLPRATTPINDSERDPTGGREKNRRSFLIDTELIKAKPQVREYFSDVEIEMLAESMRTHGQIQSVLVCRRVGGGYQLVAGERRLRAARLAGIAQLRCELVEGELTKERILELQMIENLQRADLNPVEEARGFQSLMKQHGWSMSQVAQRLGMNKSTVSRSLGLLKLSNDLIEKVRSGEIPPRLARELARLEDDREQRRLAQRYIAEELTAADAAVEINRRMQLSRDKAVRSVRQQSETNNGEDGNEIFATRIRTKNATIDVEFRKADPSTGELQAELLAAVKQIGKAALK